MLMGLASEAPNPSQVDGLSMITLKQLEALYWCAKLQSFASAANRLHTSQSAISKRISELERAIGWQPPRQRFRPHVTVARMRPGVERARELPPTPAREFAPAAVTLYRSSLDPDGAHYTALAAIEL